VCLPGFNLRQEGRQRLAAFLSKLHSFTKFLEIRLKEPPHTPLSEITGRRSKPKRERQTSFMK
jgi:hypothetical protein